MEQKTIYHPSIKLTDENIIMPNLKLVVLLLSMFVFTICHGQNNEYTWQVGVAKVKITPDAPMWMSGYAGRDRPADSVLHDLWVKSIVFSDNDKKTSVLITLDLSGISRQISGEIKNALFEKFGLTESQIIINTSHTHSGPVLKDYLSHLYPLDEEGYNAASSYTSEFKEKVIQCTANAFSDMEPAKVLTGEGLCRFQVNRRNNVESQLDKFSDLSGPNDYSVPVLKITGRQDQIKAIVFGYACHATVLNGYSWSADYPGVAQNELENHYPGSVAMFFQGCGGDQNPLPRKKISDADQYGRTLAASVINVLSNEMKEQESRLSVAYREIALKLNQPPSKETLNKIAQTDPGYYGRWATMILKDINEGNLKQEYPYPIQVWRVGSQNIFALGGEPVIEYSIRLKSIFGPESIVMGYSNDVMAYIPSVKVLREGGYEGATSQIAVGLPSTWSFSIESDIIGEFIRLAKTINVIPVMPVLIK